MVLRNGARSLLIGFAALSVFGFVWMYISSQGLHDRHIPTVGPSNPSTSARSQALFGKKSKIPMRGDQESPKTKPIPPPIGDVGVIDVVYSWVNGSDPMVQTLHQNRLKAEGFFKVNPPRMREYGAIKYSFRALEQNMPWVRHVYIISKLGLVPDWLDASNPKVTVLSDEDLYPPGHNKTTFNSNAVDINLARIPNLSECFIYFNDDMLVNIPMEPNYFCTNDGLPQIYLSHAKAPLTTSSGNTWHRSIFHSNKILNKFYHNFKEREYSTHGCYPMSRRAFQIAWDNFPDDVRHTLNAVVRSTEDIQTPFFVQHIAIESLQAPWRYREPGKVDLYYSEFEPDEQQIERILEEINKERDTIRVICINDKLGSDIDKDDRLKAQVFAKIQWFYEELYPEKSSFEL